MDAALAPRRDMEGDRTGRDGRTAFRNWIICWVLLPNAPFCLLWFIGGPQRGIAILVTAFLGLTLNRAPFVVRYAGFVASIILSSLLLVSSIFNLSILSLFDALRYAGELKASSSPEYIAAGLAAFLTLAIGWRVFHWPGRLTGRPYFLAALIGVGLLQIADAAIGRSARGSYGRVPSIDAPFSSAVSESGFEALATGNRHLVIIMVEAMGAPATDDLKARLLDAWAPPAVQARYEVSTGTNLYYGSTTSGELRELCGRWGDYRDLIGARETCLPARLAAKGYDTQAWHSFEGSMFDRNLWYPNIGFQQMVFSDALFRNGARRCPGVFPGACDADVPTQIGEALKDTDRPQFLYWLTVNSHLPVIAHEALGTTNCAPYDAGLAADYPMICRLFQVVDGTARTVVRTITADDFPEADILIVGDHIPPFFQRRDRNLFQPDKVPWILLRRKNALLRTLVVDPSAQTG